MTDRADNLGQLLLGGFRWFDHSLRTSLAAAGWPQLSLAQSLIFAYLDGDGTRPSELARRMGVTRQAIHQSVGGLVEMGLLRYEPDPTHGQAKLIKLTDQGRDNVAAAVAAFAAIEADLADRVGRTAIIDLRRALEAEWGEPAPVALNSTTPPP